MATGWGHAAALTRSGDILVWGRTRDFRNTVRTFGYSVTMPWLIRFANWVSRGSALRAAHKAAS